MNYKVVYFTRTGQSAKIAETISKKLACPLIQITDTMNWNGFFGFIKGGFYASANKNVKIKINGNIEKTDSIVLVAPFWAGSIAPSAKAFLKTVQADAIHLVVISGGPIPSPITGFQSVYNINNRDQNEENVLTLLIKNLTRAS